MLERGRFITVITNLKAINFFLFAGDFNMARYEGDCTDIVIRSFRA